MMRPASLLLMFRRGLAAARYVHLVKQIAKEEGYNQSATAERLGLDRRKDQPWIGQALKDEQTSAGLRKIERAMEALDLSCHYFFAPGEVELDYKQFVRRPIGSGAAVAYDALAEFLQSDVGKRLTEEQVQTLQQIRFFWLEPTFDAYVTIAAGLKQCIPLSDSNTGTGTAKG